MAKRTPFEPAPDVDVLARAAGLESALRQFPQDIAAAAQSAAQARSLLGAQENNTGEPWPPMRVRTLT